MIHMNKRYVCTLVFVALFVASSSAFYIIQAERKPGFFWKIESNESKPSYLLGTLHYHDKRLLNIPESVLKHFEHSGTFVKESKWDAEAEYRWITGKHFSDGNSLNKVLDESLYREVVRIAYQYYDIPESLINQIKPWAVTAFFEIEKPKQELKKAGSASRAQNNESTNIKPPEPETDDKNQSMDFMLYQMAVKQGKAVDGLETVEDQLAAFDSIPIQDQIVLLRAMIKDFLAENNDNETGQYSENKLVDIYLSDDLNSFNKDTDEIKSRADIKDSVGKMLHILNDERNIRLKKNMKPHLIIGNTFFAVGALHLSGEKGIINLLRKEGFKVTPIALKN